MAESGPRMTEVRCAEAPSPGGHYAQAMLHGDVLYVSGQLGVTSDMAEPSGISVTDQVAFALGNVERIARVVGSDRADVVKCTVYVADVEHWGEANRAYAAFFGHHRPARSIVACGALHFGAKVEIEAIVAVAPRPAGHSDLFRSSSRFPGRSGLFRDSLPEMARRESRGTRPRAIYLAGSVGWMRATSC